MSHTVEPHSLLDQVEEMFNTEKSHHAIDMLYNIVDVASYEYMSEVCLAAAEKVETLPISILISLLTITLSYKDKVILRDILFAATMARVVERTPHRVRGLLDGLEGSNMDPWTTA